MTAKQNLPQLPVLLGLSDMVDLFPRTAKTTIYRWNTERSGKRLLPDPIVRASGGSLWTEEQVREFAEARGVWLDESAMGRIRKSQGH